jgi:hypothetical protein
MSHPYENLPRNSYWSTSISAQDPLKISDLAKPKERLSSALKIATAGSCFAQHIARHMRARGFDFLDMEPAPPHLAPEHRGKFGYGVYSARYANIYTTAQLRQLVERAYHRRTPVETYWKRGGRFFDPFRTLIEPNGFTSEEEIKAETASHLRSVQDMFKSADLFIFTLGLTEAWRSKIDGAIFPVAPGVQGIGEFDPEKYEFVNFGFNQVRADLLATMIFLKRRVNRRLRFLLTVSPIPLAATASGHHVLTATTYSKSVLRAVAGDLVQNYDFVDYFPSFEVVSSHPFKGAFFDSNGRDVTEAGVNHVMGMFARDFCILDQDKSDESVEVSPQDLFCEEQVLDFYGSS